MGSGRRKEFSPDEVLSDAMRLFWSEGYAGTNFDRLIQETGVGRQSLYDTFGDKDELYHLALERYGETEISKVTDQLTAAGDPLENIRAVFEMWRAHASAPDFAGCFLGNSIGAARPADLRLAEIHRAHLLKLEGAFHTALRAAMESGSLPSTTNARRTARALVALSQGLFLMAQAGAGRAAVRDITAAAHELLGQDRAPRRTASQNDEGRRR